jgi:type IV pilus assembly protein PilB
MADAPKLTPLQQQLVKIRRAAEERDAQRRAEHLGVPYVDISRTPVSMEALKLVPEAEARAARVATIELKIRELAVAAFDPSAPKAKEAIGKLAKAHYRVKTFAVSQSGLEEAWKFYKYVPKKTEDITGTFKIARVEELSKTLKTLDAVRAAIDATDLSKLSTTNLFEVVLAGALANRASDIHFEAEEDRARLRYRVDGYLHDAYSDLPMRNYDSIISRIKLLSGMKINVHSEAQDGRFTINIGGKDIEMRVSVTPSEFGEAVVMRILDPDAIQVDLETLGLRADDLELVRRHLKQPNGLILNTGPTGSGKTTTLYAFLKEIVDPEIKIITIEDPIEYRVDGIEQTQVDDEAGYTFASGLRALMRQDPDVILVGEVRDLDTASIALQAALTGHLVFSTLHTNSAVGAVPRFIDLGVQAHSIGPATNLIIAQRLVRRLCPRCRTQKPLDETTKKNIATFFDRLPKRIDATASRATSVFAAVGCDQCNGIGYRGRIGIYEFLDTMGPEFEKRILSDPSEVNMRDFAKTRGFVPMQDDGILKALAGVTSLEEVESVTGPISWEGQP